VVLDEVLSKTNNFPNSQKDNTSHKKISQLGKRISQSSADWPDGRPQVDGGLAAAPRRVREH